MKGFVDAWCAISLLACATLAAQPPAGAPGAQPRAKAPVLALLDPADAPQWNWVKDLGWKVVTPAAGAEANADARVLALAAAVQDAISNAGVDPARVYLAGRGAASAAVFYAVSRMPDLWAAAIAVGGSPQPAIDGGRIYAGNFHITPILWVGVTPQDQALAEKLKAAGMNLEWRLASGLKAADASQWLAGRTRDEFPPSIDCETSSPAFARCFWTQTTQFDANERNDVLPTTLIPPSPGAVLDLGPFDYQRDDPGPGLLVSALPPKYDGPLKTGDRIVELDGKPIANAAQFVETMQAVADSKDAVALVQRGAERKRIETHISVPKRAAAVTARVQATYVPEEKEIQIITRAVAQLRVTIPPQWVPATLYWNGLSLDELKMPGCLALHMEKELLRAEKCE
ncbi:MAG: hypothetical protein ABSC23_08370 [Bryobacteraceae bacterium]